MLTDITGWIGLASNLIDDLGVSVILLEIIIAAIKFLLNLVNRQHRSNQFDLLRIRIGKAMLLGLEILVAADVIRTVALQPTRQFSHASS